VRRVDVLSDTSRRIADPTQNVHVANGIDAHQTTTIGPTGLLRPLSRDVLSERSSRQREIEAQLRTVVGEPFFAGNGFIVYATDSLNFLDRLADAPALVALTVTSPPYNIGKEYEVPMSVADYITWCARWMEQVHRVTNDRGAFWLNVGYLEVPGRGLCVPIPYLLWDKSSFYLLQEVVWKYGAGVASRHRLSPRNEKWLFYVKDPKNYVFNLDEIRDPNVKYPNQKKNGKYRCNPFGKNPSDVWEFPKVTTGKNRSSKERTDHPAQFPLAVVERVIRASSNTLDVVLDPFAGSSSAGIAAMALGRIYIGVEIRRDYCELAAERYQRFAAEQRDASAQATIF
jgi:adenine-specific DNA-methyltransferase